MANPMILLEANEHSPHFIEKFRGEGALPNFDRFWHDSEIFTTRAHDAALNPWVQWVTLHAGIGQDQHAVEKLGEGDRFQGSRIWDDVSRAGYRFMLCSSMNVGAPADEEAWVLPDPWSELPRSHDHLTAHTRAQARSTGTLATHVRPR